MSARVLSTLIVGVWFLAAYFTSFPDSQGTDFYPVSVCAEQVLIGRSPYGKEVAAHLEETWEVVKEGRRVAPVCSYPLPFYFFAAPIALFPYHWGLFAWFSLMLLYPIIFGALDQDERAKAFLPVAYYPLFHAATVKTSSVLWGICVALLILGTRRRRHEFVGFFWALLPAKPQVGLFFTLATTGELFRLGGRAVSIALITVLSTWIFGLVLFPQWPFEWFHQLKVYQSSAAVTPFMPLELLAPILLISVVLFWNVSKIGFAAILQLTLFPTNDLYCAIPLLFAWEALPVKISLVGAAISWLIPLVYEYPNNLEAMWVFLLLPLLVSAVMVRWRFRT